MNTKIENDGLVVPIFSFWQMLLLTFGDVLPVSKENLWHQPVIGPEGDLAVCVPRYSLWEMFLTFCDIDIDSSKY